MRALALRVAWLEGAVTGQAPCYVRFPSYCFAPGSIGSHLSRRATHSSYVGARSVGEASNTPSWIAISSVPSETPNNADPQRGQKCRTTVVAFGPATKLDGVDGKPV